MNNVSEGCRVPLIVGEAIDETSDQGFEATTRSGETFRPRGRQLEYESASRDLEAQSV